MSELARQLRAAFAAEQRGLEPIADAPGRLLERGLVGRRRVRFLPQLAAAAAIVLAVAAVVGILMLTRSSRGVPAHSQPTVAPTWKSTLGVAPTPMASEFNAPARTPALVFHDAADHAQLDAVTWDGTGAGRLTGIPNGEVAVANPAGTLFITPHGIVDRRDKAAGTVAFSGKQLPVWADDGRTICRITPDLGTAAGTPAYLETADINGGWRRIGQYGTVHEQSGVSLAACSVLNDRAVIVEHGGQGLSTNQLWVVQLTTGRVIWSRSYQPGGTGVIDILASRDGSHVAEGAATCCPIASFKTTLFGPGGSVLSTFDGHAGGYSGSAFSWDGSRMVLASGAAEQVVTVVDVRSGAAVWTAPSGLKVAGVAAEPVAGGRLAVILNANGAFAGSDGYVPPGDLYLVDASGAGHQVTGFRARP